MVTKTFGEPKKTGQIAKKEGNTKSKGGEEKAHKIIKFNGQMGITRQE